MGNILMTGSGGGGAGSDDCTGTAAELLKGYTGILKGSDDEPIQGALELTGNAQAGHVLNGETFYNNDAKSKQTGTLIVNSLLSFNVAAYSGRRIIANWTNPNQAAGRPYSGVIIRYDTGGYPGTTGGVQIYKGAGNNHSAGAVSQAFLDMPNLNTTYYFTAIPYVTTNIGDLLGTPVNATVRTGDTQIVTIQGTQNYTIPGGFSMMDLFGIGGGGSGYQSFYGTGSSVYSGDGGGSGYTQTVKNIPISEGQVLACVVGSGGISSNGGGTSVSRSGVTLLSAVGGEKGLGNVGGSGGSGGGGGTKELGSEIYPSPGRGGQNGNNGSSGYVAKGGKGQGTTTRAFGEDSGTLYGDGGGAGGAYGNAGAVGGSGLGGRGGERANPGMNGTPNTGSGGGGAGTHGKSGGAGGSGVILLRLY